MDLTKGDFGFVSVPSGRYIMEIKTSGAMPLWLAEALNALKIYPRTFSKYGNVYKEELAGSLFKNDVAQPSYSEKETTRIKEKGGVLDVI